MYYQQPKVQDPAKLLHLPLEHQQSQNLLRNTAKSFTKFEDVKLHLRYSISPRPCKIIIAPFAGLKMSCSQQSDIERKPRTDAQQIRLTFTYICYHASQRLTQKISDFALLRTLHHFPIKILTLPELPVLDTAWYLCRNNLLLQ